MNKIINNKKNNNISIISDDPELNDFLYCWDEFSSRPNKILIHNTYSTKLFCDILDKYILEKNNNTEILTTDNNIIINDRMFAKIDDNIYCSYFIIDKCKDNSIVSEIVFFYKKIEDFEKIKSIIDELNSCISDFCDDDLNNLNTISISQGEMEIEPIDTTDFNCDNFELYYHYNTYNDINKLIKQIKQNNKGLSILYGKKGTGKTSIIKYLSNKLDRIVIFIPFNMIDNTINNPEFRLFLKRYTKPILIIDDCEMLYGDVFSKSNIFTNNILQMVDGFLSDVIEVNVITIFNIENETYLDQSLIDCNNLLKVIKFEYLSNIESSALSDYIGYNKKYDNSSTVLDVINKNTSKSESIFGL